MKTRYIEKGYMYSGCVNLDMVYRELKLSNADTTRELIQAALDAKYIEPHGCSDTTWILPLKHRKKLIIENNLSIIWEEKASCFEPNGEHGEITQVLKQQTDE